MRHFLPVFEPHSRMGWATSMSTTAIIILLTQGPIQVTRKFPVNSNGLHGEVDVQLSPFGILLVTQPLHLSEQHTRANLEFSSNFGFFEINIENWWNWKMTFFESASSRWKLVTNYAFEWIWLNFYDFDGLQPKMTHTKHSWGIVIVSKIGSNSAHIYLQNYIFFDFWNT